MALDTHGFFPDNTPNPALGQIANTITENSRYNEQKKYQRQQRQEAKAESNRLYNLREIDQDTDPTKFKTGEERFDNYTQKELSGIKNKALSEYVNLDPVEAEYRLTNDMQGLIGWHNAVKSNIDNIKTGLTDFNKTYPNINAQKAHELSFLELGNDYLEKDANGEIVRKDPALAKPRDYVSELNTPDKLSEIVEDVTPFAKYIQSFKPQKSGAKEYQSKRGYMVKHGYTAEVTPFSEIETNDDGKPIGVKLQSEDFNYNGGTLKMLPERQFDDMMEVPQVRASIIGMWGKHKKQFEEETGQKITPANEDKMLRGFLYDEIKNKNLDQNFFKQDDAVSTPRITINNNSSSNQPTQIDLTDKGEYPDVGNGFQDVSRLFGGVKVTGLPNGSSLNADYIQYNPITKKVKYKEYYDKDQQAGGRERETDLGTFLQNVKTLNPTTDMKHISGLYKAITGTKNEPPKPTGKVYKYNGHDYSEQEIEDAAKNLGMSKENYMKKYGIK